MSSPAQITANTANAQHSTGPQTPEGKARSAQNARTHGLTAREALIAPGEQEEFDELLAAFRAEIDPQGSIQQRLFDELVLAAWNLRRIHRMEAEMSATASPEDNDGIQQKLDRIARHQVRIERTFHRSLNELKSLQTDAIVRATLYRPLRDGAPPLMSAIQIAKRTQYLERHHPVAVQILLERLAKPAQDENRSAPLTHTANIGPETS